MRFALGAVLVAVILTHAALGQAPQPVRAGQPLGQRPQVPAAPQNTAPRYVAPAAQPAANPGYAQPGAPLPLQMVPRAGTAGPLPASPQGAAAQAAPGVPFVLSAAEQAQLERVLQVWEQNSAKVKTFSCKLSKWHYDSVFNAGKPDQPVYQDQGELQYRAPDCGAFKIEGPRAEHWICDGKSIFHYQYDEKKLIETPLPEELRGEGVRNGPIPFLFGAKADEIKRRYYVRMITPPDVKDQIWLEAYPRYQQDAANFFRVELILSSRDMQPQAIQVFQPNGSNRDTFIFSQIVVNDPLRFLKLNPFAPLTPLGWQKVVEKPTTTVAAQPASPAPTRPLPPGSLR